MKQVFTAWDARNERIASEYRAPSAAERRADLDRANRAIAAQYPQIGELIRNGRPVFYISNPYREARDPRILIPESHPDDAPGFVEFPAGEFPQ